jgi:hypothetical protein
LQSIITRFQIHLILEELGLSLLGIDIAGLIMLIIIGIIIIFIIRLLLMLIPAALVAIVVWFITGSVWLAGIAFLLIAALSILKKIL